MDSALELSGRQGSTSVLSDVGKSGYLYGPKADFFLLGGASLFLLPLLLFLPEKRFEVQLSFVMLALANLINHPHFAHSYQIFYRQFANQLMGEKRNAVLRARYVFAGVIVPILLAGYFTFGIVTENKQWVGMSANIMALFVGWHYVKQGYGLLMVDAALKRNFFSDAEKKILLTNSYAVWTSAWLFGNTATKQRDIWGVEYYSFNFPPQLIWFATGVVALTTLLLVRLLWRRLSNGKGLPANGVVAYLVSLYLWLLFIRIDPLWVLVVPAFHSIQYMAVVYRFQTNREHSRSIPLTKEDHSSIGNIIRSSHAFRVTIFVLTGVAIGIALFWKIPGWLDFSVPYDREIFGANLFLFSFWIFVNVHHYFIDNVIWRRENPESRLYLFEANRPA